MSTPAVSSSSIHDFRWPAEWERHLCTWGAWPVNPQTWPGLFPRIPADYAVFIAALARFEPVRLLAGGPDVAESARVLLESACERAGSEFPVELLDVPVNDSWCRDYGPIFLTGRTATPAQGHSLIIDWDYDAWGGKYGPCDRDQQAADAIARRLNLPSVRPGLVLEGGAIEGDGNGTVLTTTSCLTCQTRNPGATRDSMERALRDFLLARHVVWLPGGGIVGDDTDGHIDQSARFVDPQRVLVAAPWSEDAPEANLLRENRDALAAAVNAAGQSLTVIDLPLPRPKFFENSRLPASYCNYCLADGAVIVPVFQDPADDIALDILQRCYPDRTIASVDARNLIWGLGAFHCMTQQQPDPGPAANPQ